MEEFLNPDQKSIPHGESAILKSNKCGFAIETLIRAVDGKEARKSDWQRLLGRDLRRGKTELARRDYGFKNGVTDFTILTQNDTGLTNLVFDGGGFEKEVVGVTNWELREGRTVNKVHGVATMAR